MGKGKPDDYYKSCIFIKLIVCIVQFSWRELAAENLTVEERDPLYNQWNSLWQENINIVSTVQYSTLQLVLFNTFSIFLLKW